MGVAFQAASAGGVLTNSNIAADVVAGRAQGTRGPIDDPPKPLRWNAFDFPDPAGSSSWELQEEPLQNEPVADPNPSPPDESMADAKSKPGKRRRRFRIRFIVLQLLIVLCLLEGGLRIYAHATDNTRGLGFDADFGWKPLPGVEKRGREWCGEIPARMNSRGWRDAEHALAKPPGTLRIVALGDSITFGQAVDYGQRFTEVIEEKLDGVEVINLAVTGHGTDQELRIFEEEGRLYAPDLVLLNVFVGNDLEDIRHEKRFGWPKPYFQLEDGGLELVPPTPSLEIRLRTSSYLAEGLFRVFGSSSQSRLAPEWESADSMPLFAASIPGSGSMGHACWWSSTIPAANPRTSLSDSTSAS